MSGEEADKRPISPFQDSQQNIRCPSCDYPHSFNDMNQEGGIQCEGCGRKVELQIVSYDQFAEWRNIPESEQHKYR